MHGLIDHSLHSAGCTICITSTQREGLYIQYCGGSGLVNETRPDHSVVAVVGIISYDEHTLKFSAIQHPST